MIGTDMSAAAVTSRLEAIAFDVADPSTVAGFWAGVLHRELVPEAGGVLVPGDRTQIGLRFVATRAAQIGRPRLHLHLTSRSREEQQQTVEDALRLGGRPLDVGQGVDDEFVVQADPGRNELCVIEPGNGFLAGTGFLGEVTCEGTSAVGRFRGNALGWPLVWEEGDQTAIQSPLGGTKISWDSWDAGPRERTIRRSRQRFDLVCTDPTADAERLVSIGATHVHQLRKEIELADPDGTTFSLRAG